MKGFLNTRRVSSALSAICFVALGVVLVAWPDLSRIWICRVLGAALLLSGGSFVISHFWKATGAKVVFQFDLIVGVVLAIAGVWLFTTPDLIVTFIQYILGVILVVHGIIDAQGAWNLRSGGSAWWYALLLAVITIAFGAVILWNPFATINALLILVGIALIYDGLSDLIILINLIRTYKKEREEVPVLEAACAEVLPAQGAVTEEDILEKENGEAKKV